MKRSIDLAIALFCLLGLTLSSTFSWAADYPRPQNKLTDPQLCLDCHDPDLVENYRRSPHAGLDCLDCHPGASEAEHSPMPAVDCLKCHQRHDEKKAHDAHLTVSCQACHLEGLVARRDPKTKLVIGSLETQKGQAAQTHLLLKTKEEASCRRCHLSGNQLGASDMVLPAKSLICLPCHAATFTIRDTITVVSLLIFGLGCLGPLIICFSGTSPQAPVNQHGRRGFFSWLTDLAAAFFLDVLLQRRLWQRSRVRWLIHALIFQAMMVRFLWGATALILSLVRPQWNFVWSLLDKNHPATAFIFDLTGLMILLGVVLILYRRLRPKALPIPGLPPASPWALLILGGLTLSGLIVEGARIAMTGLPPGATYAFLGLMFALLFNSDPALTGLYGYLWYGHAILAGAFIAILPFSRMLHLILAPVILMARAHREPRS